MYHFKQFGIFPSMVGGDGGEDSSGKDEDEDTAKKMRTILLCVAFVVIPMCIFVWCVVRQYRPCLTDAAQRP